MAEGIEQLRRQYARIVAGTMGVADSNRRQLEAERDWSGREAEVIAMPQDLSQWRMLQDPLTGAWPFMVGFSVVGGPDLIG